MLDIADHHFLFETLFFVDPDSLPLSPFTSHFTGHSSGTFSCANHFLLLKIVASCGLSVTSLSGLVASSLETTQVFFMSFSYYYFLNPQMLWFLQRSLFIHTLIYFLQSKSLLWMDDSYHQCGDVAVNQINQGLFTLSTIWWETRETRHKAKNMEAGGTIKHNERAQDYSLRRPFYVGARESPQRSKGNYGL